MPDTTIAPAARSANLALNAPNSGDNAMESGIATIEQVPQDIANVPLFQHMEQVMPAADLLLGGGILIAIMLVHAAGVRSATNHIVRRAGLILENPTRWRADALMAGGVFMLLSLHVLEMFLWAASLVYSGLVPNWRAAGFFAGNTYTTIGYGNFVLPPKWGMMAPIIGISGLFTFGWSGSVLVDLVGRCQKIKDAAAAAPRGSNHRGLPK